MHTVFWLRHRWKDDIRIGLRETGWEGVEWIHLAQDRDQWQAFMNMVMNIWVPQKVESFFTSQVTISFSSRTLLHGENHVNYQDQETKMIHSLM
jgi:hypothetical protein